MTGYDELARLGSATVYEGGGRGRFVDADLVQVMPGSRAAAASSRARRSAGGRSRLPTWSARNGGLVRAAMALLSLRASQAIGAGDRP